MRVDRTDAIALDSISRLEAAGCARVVLDSGVRGGANAGVFAGVTKNLSAGDVLMVTDLHHLSGKLGSVLEQLTELRSRGIWVEDLSSGLNTSSEAAASVLRVLADFVQVRHDTRPDGSVVRVGRPRRMSSEDIARARKLLKEDGRSIGDLVKELGVSRATLYRSLRELR